MATVPRWRKTLTRKLPMSRHRDSEKFISQLRLELLLICSSVIIS